MCKALMGVKGEVRSEEAEMLSSLIARAELAKKETKGIEITAKEADTFVYFTQNCSIYLDARPAEESFDIWLKYYFMYPRGVPHRLDYARDAEKDYSLALPSNRAQLGVRLQNLDNAEIAAFAKELFFCSVALLDKMDEARCCTRKGFTLTSSEAFSLVYLKSKWSSGPNGGNEQENQSKQGEQTAFRRLIAATAYGKPAKLTVDEVEELFSIYEVVPRPAPLQMLSRPALKAKRECLQRILGVLMVSIFVL
jgi:hypothetical protein